jgi:26S proteasome regulatory subunit T6
VGKDKALVKMSHEGKYIVSIKKDIDKTTLKSNTRIALKKDSYEISRVLPTNVDPIVSLMKVEKVPDSTYDMIGGLKK